MNTKDVLTTVALLLGGIVIGWYGRGQVTVSPSGTAPAPVVATQNAPTTASPVANTPTKADPPPTVVEPTTPPSPPQPQPQELSPLVKSKLPNTAFALQNAPINGDVEKAKVAIIAFSDFQ